jgi:hypothetical protein
MIHCTCDDVICWELESLQHSWWNYLEDVIYQQLMEHDAA